MRRPSRTLSTLAAGAVALSGFGAASLAAAPVASAAPVGHVAKVAPRVKTPKPSTVKFCAVKPKGVKRVSGDLYVTNRSNGSSAQARTNSSGCATVKIKGGGTVDVFFMSSSVTPSKGYNLMHRSQRTIKSGQTVTVRGALKAHYGA